MKTGNRFVRFIGLVVFGAVWAGLAALPCNGAIFTITAPAADAFLATGSAGNPEGSDLTALNYGASGSLAISPANSLKGEFNTVLRFNFAGAVNQFNTTFGADNWEITALTLRLASNLGTQGATPNEGIFNTVSGGQFGIARLGFDSWVEGPGRPSVPSGTGVNHDSISTLFSLGSDSLGTFTYTPPGNNVYASYNLPLNANLVADAEAGGDVSLYLFATDSQISYLFNSRSFALNHPQMEITAVPEPGANVWVAMTLLGFVGLGRFRRSAQLAKR